MVRPLLAFCALLAVGALSSIAAIAADSPAAGVTALKDARAEGNFTLDANYLNQKKPTFNPDFSADGFGLANVHVLLRKADQGAFNGQYGVGIYATEGASAAPTKRFLLFMPTEAPLAITYVKEKRSLLTLCQGDQCTVQRYLSDQPTIQFTDVYATIYVVDDGKRLIGLRRTVSGGCEIALGDTATKFNDVPDWDWWRVAETRAALKDGEEATLKGGDIVRCHADPAGTAAAGSSLEFVAP
jgi:hypothetical protein